jgi:hypothetical protein
MEKPELYQNWSENEHDIFRYYYNNSDEEHRVDGPCIGIDNRTGVISRFWPDRDSGDWIYHFRVGDYWLGYVSTYSDSNEYHLFISLRPL